MRMKRTHGVEISRYYQRLENIEKRRKEAEQAKSKKGFFRRLLNV